MSPNARARDDLRRAITSSRPTSEPLLDQACRRSQLTARTGQARPTTSGGQFPGKPAVEPPPTVTLEPSPRAGHGHRHYKLLEQMGRGFA